MKINKMHKKIKLSAERYFRRYLKIAPLSVALVRSVEARNFATVKMVHPILDLGCGFGEFAKVFFDNPIDMGVDNAPFDLYAASKVKKYKNLLLADARNLPIADGSYSTVISVSTMEHIKNADMVFEEAYRVLKPNGILIVSMETDEVDRHTFYLPLLRRMGLSFISNHLLVLFNTLFHRHMLLSKNDWKQRILKAGFVIKESRDIVPPSVIKYFDMFIPTAWPAQLFRPFIGRRVVFRPQFVVNFLTRLFIKYLDDNKGVGTVLFIVARKPQVKEA